MTDQDCRTHTLSGIHSWPPCRCPSCGGKRYGPEVIHPGPKHCNHTNGSMCLARQLENMEHAQWVTVHNLNPDLAEAVAAGQLADTALGMEVE